MKILLDCLQLKKAYFTPAKNKRQIIVDYDVHKTALFLEVTEDFLAVF